MKKKLIITLAVLLAVGLVTATIISYYGLVEVVLDVNQPIDVTGELSQTIPCDAGQTCMGTGITVSNEGEEARTIEIDETEVEGVEVTYLFEPQLENYFVNSRYTIQAGTSVTFYPLFSLDPLLAEGQYQINITILPVEYEGPECTDYYRFEDNTCEIVCLLPEDVTEDDYETLEECEEQIEELGCPQDPDDPNFEEDATNFVIQELERLFPECTSIYCDDPDASIGIHIAGSEGEPLIYAVCSRPTQPRYYWEMFVHLDTCEQFSPGEDYPYCLDNPI